MGGRLKVEIYTDARAASFRKSSTNWDSGVGIGGILVINGEIVEFPSLELDENTTSAKRIKVSAQTNKFMRTSRGLYRNKTMESKSPR